MAAADLDLVEVLDKMTECCICLCQFELPKVLPCQHTFCKACMSNLVNNNHITCPTCRRIYDLKEDGVDNFPPNVTISELIDLQEAAKAKLMLSDDAASVDEVLRQMANLKKGIHVLRDMMDTTQEEPSMTQKEAAQKHIGCVFQKYRQILSDREKQLKEKVGEILNKSVTEETRWQTAIQDKMDEAEKVVNEMKETEDGKVRISCEVLRKANNISEDILELLRGQPTATTFHFTYGSESLKNHLSDLGTIRLHKQITRHGNRRLSNFHAIPAMSPFNVDYYPSLKPLYNTETDKSVPENFCPFGLASTPNGNIIATDIENHCIYIFDGQLRMVTSFGEHGEGEGQLNRPTGVAVSRRGSIVVADQVNNRVVLFSLQGDFQYQFGKPGNHMGQMMYPCGLTMDHRDIIYVCDSGNFRIHVFQLDGHALYTFGDKDSLINQPMFNTVTTDRRILVSDGKQYIRVYKLPKNVVLDASCRKRNNSKDGSSSKKLEKECAEQNIPHPEELYKIYMNQPAGLAVDKLANIVVGHNSGHIVVIRDTGEVVCQIGTCGKGPGQLVMPRDITVTDQGHMVVADSIAHRIQIFEVSVL